VLLRHLQNHHRLALLDRLGGTGLETVVPLAHRVVWGYSCNLTRLCFALADSSIEVIGVIDTEPADRREWEGKYRDTQVVVFKREVPQRVGGYGIPRFQPLVEGYTKVRNHRRYIGSLKIIAT